jgi:hypothetical protein
MRLVVVLALAGCGFEHGALGTAGPSDDADVIPDTPRPLIDAAVDAKPDAAPTPCPDDDSDNVCNAVDDWPCGAKPTEPGATVQFMNNSGATVTTISVVNLDGTQRMAVAPPSTNVSLTFRLRITDTACSGNCVDQLEAGWVDHAANTGSRFNTCLFDNGVSKSNGLDTNLSFNVGTPGTRKVYDLRVNLGQNFSCGANGNNGWWGGQVPADARTIARLCVD